MTIFNMEELNLKVGDYIAFPFNYNGGVGNEIIVTNITSILQGMYLCHFLYGHQSLAEYVKPEDVIAIGDKNGTSKINGWSGKYRMIQPNHELLNDVEES